MNNDLTLVDNFLESPNEETFAELFHVYTRQLVAFFRAHRCRWDQAEDLAQEVMLKVYRKASQLRDRKAFRVWLFRVAKNVLCVHYGKQTRQMGTVSLEDVLDKLVTDGRTPAGSHAFEFLHWMSFLDSREREVMKLRFLEHWEYHEIATAHCVPIGTVQWRVFNAKKKLAPHLAIRGERPRKAA